MSDDERPFGDEPEDDLEDLDTDEWEDGHPPGPRRAALERRKRRERRHRTLLGAALIVVGVGSAVAIAVYTAKEVIGQGPITEPPASVSDGSSVTTTLLFGTKDSPDGKRTIWTSLLVYDREEIRGGIAYVPAHTAVEVPGRGLLALGDAYGSGGVPLLLVTAENLFGITIDRYLELNESDARVLFRSIGELTVDVPATVRIRIGAGNTRVIFEPGLQSLPAPFLTRLLFTLGEDADDVSLGLRHLAFWDALLDTFEGDPQALVDAVNDVSGSLGKSDAPTGEIADLFGDLVALPTDSRLLTTLPVSPLEVPGNRLYVTDEAELVAFIEDLVGSSASLSDQVRVQILNGNGSPGIGQQVAERLVGEGFRVILSGNAPRLDYEETLVITYDGSAAGRALAELARDLLGVGEVRVSRQEQGIVDLTIVVGKDFLRTQ